ncbi:MAG: ATPase, T2SS/T4P/T4SS family [Candidatus Falkowbacteria bacterium]
MNKSLELLELLNSKALLKPEKFLELKDSIAKDASFKLEEYLIDKEIIGEEALTEIKAGLLNLPYKNLQNEVIPEDFLHFLPKKISENYKIVCFFKDVYAAKIGMIESDFKAIEAVNFMAQSQGVAVEYFLISPTSFKNSLKQYARAEEEIGEALKAKAKTEGEDLLQVMPDANTIISEADVNSAPVAKIVSVIIRHAVESRSSDIHIEPMEKESRVRYRIDGILHNALTLPRAVHNSVVARIKVLAKLKLDETRVPQDGHIRLVVDGREIDFRISTMPLSGSEKIEMRILDQSKGLISLDDLGFNAYCKKLVLEGLKKTSGIVLLTGPTGSGKTTTLYAAINVLNKESVNISTLEDPIEYQIKGVNQSEVKPDLKYDFASGLRSLLRQDPNIIMVGEIRDDETAELAIHAGLTGHLVLSTLHTNDAIGAAFRLLDMKVEPFLLASTLRMIIAQRLVRRLCPHCKREAKLDEKKLDRIIVSFKNIPFAIVKEELSIESLDDIKNFKFYEPVGCAHCSNTGYTERVAIAEVVPVDEHLRDIIINHKNDLTIHAVEESQVFVSMKQDGLFKVIKGITNIDEVLRVIEIDYL